MKKTFKILTILLVVVLLSWQVYQKVSRSLKGSARRGGTSAVAVEVTEIQKSTIRDVGLFTGILLPRSQFIVAPKIAGRLEKLFVNVGDPVKSGQRIAILDDDEFIQQVDQAQAELKVTNVSTDALSDKTFSGRVKRIAPLLKETTRKARVEIEIPNLEGYLKPGMFVRVQIEFAVHDNAAVIPITAIIKRNEKDGVFIADIKNMKAHYLNAVVF